MSTSGDNPFASPEGGYQTPRPGGGSTVITRSSVDYMEAISKVFENPNWFVNVLLLGIANLIPIVGPIVVMGYDGELLHSKSTGKTTSYPDFDLNRIGEYLIRGFWMFLVALVASLCIFPVMIIAMFIMMLLGTSGNDGLAMLGFAIYWLAIVSTQILFGLAWIPLMIRAGLMCGFSDAFDLAWVKDFVSKMWVETLLGMLILGLLSYFIILAGCVLLCVGVIPASGVVLLVMWNFITQLYQVYISRGGQPVPFRESGKL